jgi:hypothetical protein
MIQIHIKPKALHLGKNKVPEDSNKKKKVTNIRYQLYLKIWRKRTKFCWEGEKEDGRWRDDFLGENQTGSG